MKKFLAIILSLCLLCGATAFATTTTLDQTTNTGKTEVKVTIGETYTLVIPTELNIVTGTEETLLPVKVTNYSLASTNQLQVVPVAKLNGWLCTTPEYSDPAIWCDLWHPTTDAWAGGSNPLIFTKAETQNLRVRISATEWAKAQPGTYSDTYTFTASIVAK